MVVICESGEVNFFAVSGPLPPYTVSYDGKLLGHYLAYFHFEKFEVGLWDHLAACLSGFEYLNQSL